MLTTNDATDRYAMKPNVPCLKIAIRMAEVPRTDTPVKLATRTGRNEKLRAKITPASEGSSPLESVRLGVVVNIKTLTASSLNIVSISMGIPGTLKLAIFVNSIGIGRFI
jgi:hypothetical protein